MKLKQKKKKNNLNDIQHLNKSEAIQQSVQFPAGERGNLLSFKHRSVAPIFHEEKNVKLPAVSPPRTYNSQSPECSSAHLRGTSSDPSCRRPSL